MDTAIETTGFAEWETIEKVFKFVDTVHYDIKCIDSEKHKKYTSVPKCSSGPDEIMGYLHSAGRKDQFVILYGYAFWRFVRRIFF